MDKTVFTFLTFLTFCLFIGCNNQSQEKKTTSEKVNNTSSTTPIESGTDQKTGRTNYAVIWKWATDDTELVINNSDQISRELTQLWKADIVENAYYDAAAKVDKLAYFPNIAFFLKAKDTNEAASILNKLTVVTKGIATYKLFPVGHLWLDRKTEAVNKRGAIKSFATIWTTMKSPLEGPDADQLLKAQNDTIIELWKKGVIENVYFDIEGTYTKNEKTDFVFFINADTEIAAKKICEALPFYQANIATYRIHQAGVFWMGQYKSN